MGKTAEGSSNYPGARADGFDLRTQEAFERFVRETGPWLRGYLAGRRVPFEDARDLAQEALAIVWEKRGRVEDGKALAFLRSVTRHVYLRYVERGARESSRDAELALQTADYERRSIDGVREDPSEESISVLSATQRAVPTAKRKSSTRAALLKHLSRRQRQVIELVWLRGLPRRKAARSLRIQSSTLRAYEAAAMARLASLRRGQMPTTR